VPCEDYQVIPWAVEITDTCFQVAAGPQVELARRLEGRFACRLDDQKFAPQLANLVFDPCQEFLADALALELLKQDLDAALPPTGVLAGAFTGTAGSGAGDSSSLSFFSCANFPGPEETASDIRQVELSVETPADETQPVLMRRVTTNLLAANAPAVREQVLCRRVRSFSVRYYDGSVWQDTWDSSGQGDILPFAVEVALEFALDPDQPGAAERPYRLARVFRIPCGRVAGTN